VENYYTGISDLSYSMFESSGENTAFIRDNLLLWGEIYSIPFEQIRALSIPVLNIGPWGKDFHKYSERVNLEDLTRRVPAMVEQVIRHLLG
jgi:arginine utilization protein RocB